MRKHAKQAKGWKGAGFPVIYEQGRHRPRYRAGGLPIGKWDPAWLRLESLGDGRMRLGHVQSRATWGPRDACWRGLGHVRWASGCCRLGGSVQREGGGACTSRHTRLDVVRCDMQLFGNLHCCLSVRTSERLLFDAWARLVVIRGFL